MNNQYKFSIHEKLHKEDTETSTYGCRCNNPDICPNCGMSTCALVNETHICTTPSRAWKKTYLKKKEEEKSL